MSSVDAPQLRATLLAVRSEVDRVPGAEGAVVSELCRVVQSTIGLTDDTLPAASRAKTVRLYVVPGVSPVSFFVVAVPGASPDLLPCS